MILRTTSKPLQTQLMLLLFVIRILAKVVVSLLSRLLFTPPMLRLNKLASRNSVSLDSIKDQAIKTKLDLILMMNMILKTSFKMLLSLSSNLRCL